MKSIFIKFIYEGEVDVAELIVPRNVDLQKVKKTIADVRAFLIKEYDKDGVCDKFCTDNMLCELEARTGWSYVYVDIDATIEL